MPRYISQPETRAGAIRSLLQELRYRLDRGYQTSDTRCADELRNLGVSYEDAIDRVKNLK